MEVKNTCNFDFDKSFSRIDSYLNESVEYGDVANIPARSSLSFSNGYYVNCYALFVDIRESSQLPEIHQKRVLARIYRSYISELTAIMQSYENCKEVNIIGDCVSGIFSSTKKEDVLQPFGASYYINSIVNVINYKLAKKGYNNIKIGIGLAKGKALMIQAGYKGSGLNDVVWMGDVVNKASNLCNIANKKGNDVIVVSDEVYTDLSGYNGYNNIPYQEMLHKPSGSDYYTGDIILVNIESWINSQK